MTRNKKKSKKQSRSQRSNQVVEALVSVLNERLEVVQNNIENLRGEVMATKAPAEKSAQSNPDALNQLIETQQEDVAKRLREEVLPEARRSQRFYGYLTVSENGSQFKMEKVDSISRLEAILTGVENGTIRILMNPFAVQPQRASAPPVIAEEKTPEAEQSPVLPTLKQKLFSLFTGG